MFTNLHMVLLTKVGSMTMMHIRLKIKKISWISLTIVIMIINFRNHIKAKDKVEASVVYIIEIGHQILKMAVE